MITQHDLACIYFEGNPPAQEAFDRLVRDHGRRFAEHARDYLLSCKMIDMNHEAIKAQSR